MQAAKLTELNEKLRNEVRKMEHKTRPNMRLVKEKMKTQIRLSPTVVVRKKRPVAHEGTVSAFKSPSLLSRP